MLMVQKSGIHQLGFVVYPTIYRILCISGGCLGFLPSTVRKRIHLESYSGDGIGTFNPTRDGFGFLGNGSLFETRQAINQVA